MKTPHFEPILTYPGITCETLPNIVDGELKTSLHTYEAVFNCGGFSLSPESFQSELLHATLQRKIQLGVKSIIFISDTNILQQMNGSQTEMTFRKNLGDDFAFVGVNRSQNTRNNHIGLRIVSSEINTASLREAVTKFPDACILASIPYADPDFSQEEAMQSTGFTKENSLAIRSLQMITKNNRIVPTEIAREANGFRAKVISIEELEILFEENPTKIFVIKPIGQRAGGTSTSIVGPQQRKEFLDGVLEFPAMVYDFLPPVFMHDSKGMHAFSVQVRPFCIGEKILGGSIKMSGSPIKDALDKETGRFSLPKGSLKKINELLNTSSGKSISLLVNKDGEFVGGSKGIGQNLTKEDFETFSLGDSRIPLRNPGNVQEILEKSSDLVREIQARTNKYFGIS